MPELVASDLLRTELRRTVRRTDSAQQLDAAAVIEPVGLRSLDAVHLATAIDLREDREGIITYDDRLGIDWATVDATTIDWANIDFSTINFAALEENPTLANLDEVTMAVIRQRYADEIAAGGGDAGSGEATLTIGDNTWNFEGFVCAWGHDNTQSEVFSFSSNAFGTLDDGTRTQVQADIWDDTGSNSLTGPDTSHEVTFDDIDNFDDPAVNWSLSEPELTIDGMTVSVEGTFRDVDTGEEQPGSFVGECGPGSRF